MNYLGIDSTWLQQRQSIHTAKEINQQPECWRQTCEIIQTLRTSLDTFLKPVLAQNQLRIILTGAGTSAFAGEALAPWLHQLTGHAVEAISTTDIVSAPKQFFNDDRPVLLISFGRSGNSPESVAAVDIVEQRINKKHHLILTCNTEGELARRAKDSQNMLAVLMPEATNDQSLAMTSSFSSMVVAGLCVFSDTDISEDINHAARHTEQLFDYQLSGLAALAELDFDRLVYLGSGGLKAIARETALKCMELTFGKVACLHDSPLGFRHGPKAIVTEKTLIIIFVSADAETRRYEEDLITELRKDQRALEIIALKPELFCEDNPISNDASLAFPYLAYGQCLAFFKSLQMGLSVDNPCPTGEYNRVVEGVTIYPHACQKNQEQE